VADEPFPSGAPWQARTSIARAIAASPFFMMVFLIDFLHRRLYHGEIPPCRAREPGNESVDDSAVVMSHPTTDPGVTDITRLDLIAH
jgi:hypothetical protein